MLRGSADGKLLQGDWMRAQISLSSPKTLKMMTALALPTGEIKEDNNNTEILAHLARNQYSPMPYSSCSFEEFK